MKPNKTGVAPEADEVAKVIVSSLIEEMILNTQHSLPGGSLRQQIEQIVLMRLDKLKTVNENDFKIKQPE